MDDDSADGAIGKLAAKLDATLELDAAKVLVEHHATALQPSLLTVMRALAGGRHTGTLLSDQHLMNAAEAFDTGQYDLAFRQLLLAVAYLPKE